ncbi:MAG TPA: hypothetical protein VLA43_21700, partial [Longimicrobiales bacterium]|nr:hypothetical protein [Longimicrobiales bacterium]
AFGDGEFTRLELWLEDRYASALKGQEWTERAGHYRSLALALLPPHDGPELELRVPLDLPGRDPAGWFVLVRPLDGTGVLTDLTVVTGELQGALLGCLETLVEWEAEGGAGEDRAPEIPPRAAESA